MKHARIAWAGAVHSAVAESIGILTALSSAQVSPEDPAAGV